ncbi:hypothetical protein [Stygiolobus caldivivus]|uniref:Uncharacterized protein n=1 Tax=Stygiolobus caldivivus TaxID=2824673 RepID=A0A8D5U4K6_9CREN|nr:hypothetical protein [Stygiolobus caldivivus]BCU69311.1 hypothetical protein KN1_06080 [Stygiolobus caldivivus]
MNRTLGLILSTLFIASIIIEASPLLTSIVPQAATPLPAAGQIGAIYLSSYVNAKGITCYVQSIMYVVNVSNVNLTKISTNLNNAIAQLLQSVANNVQMYFVAQNAVNGQAILGPAEVTFYHDLQTPPGTTYQYYVYYNNVSKLVFFMIGVGYEHRHPLTPPSTNTTVQVPITFLQNYIPDLSASQTYVYNVTTGTVNTVASVHINYLLTNPLSTLYDTQTGKVVSASTGTPAQEICSYLSSETILEENASGPNHVEYIGYATLSSFTIGGATLGPYTSNQIIIFSPLVFATSPSQSGFFNPIQANGNLGPALASLSTTQPKIWGRALINFTLVDGLLNNAPGNFTFQLNYSTPGPVSLSFASLGYIASLDNYPSTFMFNAYNFSNGYHEFFGIITTSNDTTLGGKTINASGYFNVSHYEGNTIVTTTYYVYLLTFIPGVKNGTVSEYVTNLYIQVPEIKPYGVEQVEKTQVYALYKGYKPNTTIGKLPVFEFCVPYPASTTFTSYFNGKQYSVTITEPKTATINFYSALIQLRAVAYEGVYEVSHASFPYYYGGLLSTPPSNISVTGESSIDAEGHLYSSMANVKATLFTNATLTFSNVTEGNFSFNGLLLTPAYAYINGTSAMGYILSAVYETPSVLSGFNEYEVAITGTEEPFIAEMYNNLPEMYGFTLLPYFQLTLSAPTVPATTTGTAPLFVELSTVPQYAYIELVDFGLWTNETSVVVTAYNAESNTLSANKGYFYAVVIPPKVYISPVTPSDFICQNYATLSIYDPDAILDPGYPAGTFTYTLPYALNYNNKPVSGPVILYSGTIYPSGTAISSSTVYKSSGVFPVGYVNGTKEYLSLSPEVCYSPHNNPNEPYEPTYLEAYVYATGQTTQIYATGITNPTLAIASYGLQYFGSNNPTVNYYFEQSQVKTVKISGMVYNYSVPFYGIAGLNVSSIISGVITPANMNVLPGSSGQVGYIDLTPQAALPPVPFPGAATPNITVQLYVRYQTDLASVGTVTVNGTYVGQGPGIYLTVPNGSFVNSGFSILYETTDYAVYHDFQSTGAYKDIARMTVPNVTDEFYIPGNVIPLYATYANLVLLEPYYGSTLPTYLAIGSVNNLLDLQWVSSTYELVNVPAVSQLLGYMFSIKVTYPNGTTVSIIPSFSNLTTLFISLDGQQQLYCNGTYDFELSIAGLVKVLHTTVQALNGSNFTISYHDYITGETLTATAKLEALQGIAPIAIQPGEVEFFLTAYPFYPIPTFAPPWFIAENVSFQPHLSISDKQYAQSAVSSVLSLTLSNITVVTGNTVGPKYMAMVYYNATSGQTVIMNVYGVKTMVSGDVVPTLVETAPASGVFNGTIPFVIIANNTIVPVKEVSNTTVYTNGSLGIIIAGKTYVLGPAGYFLLPSVPYKNISVGFNAKVYVTVSDPIQSVTFNTSLEPINFTPIRLAPFSVPPVVPIPHAPKYVYEYNQSLVITPTDQVVKIYVTSVIPYPLEFQIEALVYPAQEFNVSIGAPEPSAPLVYYSYQAVVAKPALGIGTPVPNLLVYVQLNGIASLPPGKYVIVLFAVPYAGGPALSEYPVSLIFTNVNVTT